MRPNVRRCARPRGSTEMGSRGCNVRRHAATRRAGMARCPTGGRGVSVCLAIPPGRAQPLRACRPPETPNGSALAGAPAPGQPGPAHAVVDEAERPSPRGNAAGRVARRPTGGPSVSLCLATPPERAQPLRARRPTDTPNGSALARVPAPSGWPGPVPGRLTRSSMRPNVRRRAATRRAGWRGAPPNGGPSVAVCGAMILRDVPGRSALAVPRRPTAPRWPGAGAIRAARASPAHAVVDEAERPSQRVRQRAQCKRVTRPRPASGVRRSARSNADVSSRGWNVRRRAATRRAGWHGAPRAAAEALPSAWRFLRDVPSRAAIAVPRRHPAAPPSPFHLDTQRAGTSRGAGAIRMARAGPRPARPGSRGPESP